MNKDELKGKGNGKARHKVGEGDGKAGTQGEALASLWFSARIGVATPMDDRHQAGRRLLEEAIWCSRAGYGRRSS